RLADGSGGPLTLAASADLTGAFGPTGPWSLATVGLGTSVTAVNDVPTITPVANQTIAEDGATGALAFTVGDVETAPGALTVSASSTNTALVPVASIVLGGSSASRTVTVTPLANAFGSATITLTVSDGSASSTTSFTLTVDPVNDRPVASGSATLAAIAEDTAAPPGAQVSALFAANYSDASDNTAATPFAGVAITANAATAGAGKWQYSANGATGWTAVPDTGLGDSAALLLPASYWLRFLPNPNFNGTPGALTARLADGSSGPVALAGGVDIAATFGPGSRWSAATVSLGTSVGAVNDAPEILMPATLSAHANEPLQLIIGPAGLRVEDVDASSLTVSLQASAGTPIHLAGTSGLTSVTGNGSDTVVLSGPLLSVNVALNGMVLAIGAGPDVTLTVEVSDNGESGAGGPLSATRQMHITVFADAISVVSTSGGSVTYVEDEPATVIDPGLTISDADSVMLVGARVTVMQEFSQPDELSAGTLPGGITASWDPGNGLLALSGLATLADYQTALRSVTFHTPSQGPSSAARTIAFVVDDGKGPSLAALRTVQVVPVNDRPLASGSATLAAIAEDTTAPPGAEVSALFAANFDDDTDLYTATALAGIAITANAATAAQGSWQYSADGSTGWTDVPTSGLSDASALVLPASHWLRFVPSTDWTGTPGALTVRLADSSGSPLTLTASADLTGALGPTDIWSLDTVELGTSVGALNDVPTITPIANQTIAEDGSTGALAFTVGDVETAPGTLTVSASSTNTALAPVASIVLGGSGASRTVTVTPLANAFGSATITLTVSDGSAAASTSGPRTVDPVTVRPGASGSATRAALAETTPAPPGAQGSPLGPANYSDASDNTAATPLAGVAIVANAATAAQGTWQYSANGSTGWTDVPTSGLSDASALVLPASHWLRFVPSANWNGTPGSLTVRLADGSGGPLTLAASADLTGA
ncbi:MAG: beta strand repeat-containing protein, partial [Pseudomonadota bacterium]